MSLTNESLDLLLTTENLPLSEFSPIDLWWRDKVCRPSQRKRKVYKKRTHNLTESGDSTSTEPENESENDSDSQTDIPTKWDEWISISLVFFSPHYFKEKD